MATGNVPCGIAIPQTSNPVDVKLIREFLARAELLGYESACAGTDPERFADPRTGHAADLCLRPDLEAAAGFGGPADRNSQSASARQEPRYSRPAQPGTTDSRSWNRRRARPGKGVRCLRRTALAPVRGGPRRDEGAVDAAARVLFGRVLAIRKCSDGTQARAEAASAAVVWRPRRDRSEARRAPWGRMDGRGVLVVGGFRQAGGRDQAFSRGR